MITRLLLASVAATLFTVPAAAQERDDRARRDLCPSLPEEDAGLDDCHLGSTAQDHLDAQPVPVVIDHIVVLGQGLPETPAAPAYSTVFIDRDALDSAASGRLEDALSNVAGFQQFRRSDSRSANPSAQGATLRALGGNATSRALVLLDGVPISDPFFGYIPFSSVGPERLSAIRVTRGGGSGPFGGGALAGTIAMESADAETLGVITASALANHRGDTEFSASFAPQVGDGFAVIHGRWDRGDGFFTTPEDQRVPISSRANFDAWSAGGRVVQQLTSDIEVQARVLAFEDNRTLRFDGADNSSEGQDISLRVVSRGDWEVDLVGYAQWRNFTNIVISSTRFVPVLDQKDTPASGLGGKIEIRPPVGGGHTLRFGVDYRRSEGDLFEDSFSAFTGNLRENRFAGGVNTDFGLFVEDDWQIGDLTLTGGVRADRYTIRNGFYRAVAADGTVVRDDSFADRADWEVTWRAGALYYVTEEFTLRGAVYSGFRLPTLNELYRPFVVFPVVTQANEALEPERLEGWELGAELFPADGVYLAATYFDNEVEGVIANVTLQPNLRQRRNLDAIDAQGFELTAAVDRGPFSLNASAVFTDAEFVGTGFAAPLDGNRPPQTPEFSASLTAAYEFMQDGSIAATLRYVSSQFEGDQENDVLPAATALDFFAQLPIVDRLSFIARAENLLDEEIVTRNQGGSIDLGVPRTIWLGLRWGY
ncbi:TonB-dependent receptor plug domain-containing protein [Aurantiacibacter sp. D1-12]|uniref:TonB-dependent receptor plug domain-containing protein n=1 Tax=Aurantiacibacter sp. D1-12 TaxID=2993658 RepID=UPI00237C6BC6|nr:TonB-dependent receptor [Aurantiacibacter sp. D1-12]MDE1467583.1 TonB-dependent receptor [Aurantiacibacter sp. D1-12]